MPELGAPELLIILLITLLVFGGSKVAELGGSMGKSVKEFKKAMRDDDEPAANAAPSSSAAYAVPDGSPAITVPAASKILGPSCNRCGAANVLYSHFCNDCGAPLSTTTTGAVGILASRRLNTALVHFHR